MHCAVSNQAPVDRLLSGFVDSGLLPSCSACVWRGGREIYRFQKGRLHEDGGEVGPDTLFRIFSLTKVVTAVAALILYERGELRMDDPIGDCIPSFQSQRVLCIEDGVRTVMRPVTRPNTVRSLLTMTSGIPYYHPGRTPSQDMMAEVWRRMNADIRAGKPWDTARAVDEIGRVPLQFSPGESFLYGLSIDVLGGVIEAVSGMRLGDFMKREIFEPLGLRNMDFYATPEKREHLSDFFAFDERAGRYRDSRDFQNERQLSRPAYEEGGDGLLSTMDDYMTFARMLAGGGSLDGARILGRKTAELMRTDHLTAEQAALLGRAMPIVKGYGYGLGVRVMRDPILAGWNSSVGEFGWYGKGGSWMWIDPQEDVAGVFFTQRLGGDMQQTIPRFMAAVYGNLVD